MNHDVSSMSEDTMEIYFLLIYEGEDKESKLRILTSDSFSEEISVDNVDYFNTHKIKVTHGKSAFYIFSPLGGHKNKLDFKEVMFCGILSNVDDTVAWKYFSTIDSELLSQLYDLQLSNIITSALAEKEYVNIH